MTGPAVPQTILVVLDGASEPLRPGAPTSLESAVTPTLDRLAAGGQLLRVATTPAGLPPGTEVGLPGLLGVELGQAPSRGRIEAAAAGIALGADEGAWRLDVLPRAAVAGGVPAEVSRAIDRAVTDLGGRVRPLRGHRLLLTGPSWWGDAPPGPHQTGRPLRELVAGPFAGVAKASKVALRAAGISGVAWPWGRLGAAGELPHVGHALGRVVLVTAGGAAAGVGRLLGTEVIRAEGRRAVGVAVDAVLTGAAVVVVHVEDADEAAHDMDGPAKVAALAAADEVVVAPLAALAERRGLALVVTADHGCDPSDGGHTGEPVPALRWRGAPDSPVAPESPADAPDTPDAPAAPADAPDAPVAAGGPALRLTERATSAAPCLPATQLLAPSPIPSRLRRPEGASGESVHGAAPAGGGGLR